MMARVMVGRKEVSRPRDAIVAVECDESVKLLIWQKETLQSR